MYDNPIKAPEHNNIDCPIDVDTADNIIKVSPIKFKVKGNATEARLSRKNQIDNRGITTASPL